MSFWKTYLNNMSSFKDIAYQILKEAGKPLHSKEITKIALKRGWLKTAGKTPEATMNAQLIVDINKRGAESVFIKTAPSTFALNPKVNIIQKPMEYSIQKIYKISKNLSSKQKGILAESRIAELITLYSDTSLSCFKPLSDDEGIDLIVKKRGEFKTMFLQVKSRFGTEPNLVYTATVKRKTLLDNYSMSLVFCYFDLSKGDLWDYLWFIPAPDFISKANKLQKGEVLGFVAGRQKKESNKWDSYLVEKCELGEKILEQMERV